MIFVELMEALDVLATAVAVWIVAFVAAVTAAGWVAAWALRTAWRRLTGSRSAEHAPEAELCPQCAHEAPQAPYSESGYQEAA